MLLKAVLGSGFLRQQGGGNKLCLKCACVKTKNKSEIKYNTVFTLMLS